MSEFNHRTSMNGHPREPTIARAIAYLDAVPDPDYVFRFRYFAHETSSWWSITERSLYQLGILLNLTPELATSHPSGALHVSLLGGRGGAYDRWAQDDVDGFEVTLGVPQPADLTT